MQIQATSIKVNAVYRGYTHYCIKRNGAECEKAHVYETKQQDKGEMPPIFRPEDGKCHQQVQKEYKIKLQGVQPMQEKKLLCHARNEGLRNGHRCNPCIRGGWRFYWRVRSMNTKILPLWL